MQNLRFSIAAGETKVFEIAGRYLEIIEATGPVDIGLYDRNGSQADDGKGLLSGTYMETAYSKFELTSQTAQTVELFLTDTRGGTRRQPGNVRVIDEVLSGCQSINVGVPLAVVAFRADTILAAGASAVGATLRGVGITTVAGAGGTSRLRVVAASVQPTSFASAAQQIILGEASSANGSSGAFGAFDLKKKLPAGWGIWIVTEILTAAAASASAFASLEQ